MEKIIIYEEDFSDEDHKLIRSILEEHDVLQLFKENQSINNVWLYRKEDVLHKTQSRALIDRNILKDILSIARIDKHRDHKFTRLGAALILFFQLADIDVEPSFAIHENPEDALSMLSLFRQIDSAKPECLLKIIKGEWLIIPPEHLPTVSEDTLAPDVFKKNLTGTLIIKTALTKIACIDRKQISPYEKAKEFIDWIHLEYIHVREATYLCFYHFAPNSMKSILKQTKSSNFNNIKNGIDNAIADILLIRSWISRCHQQNHNNTLWLLSSRDKPLINLARRIPLTGESQEEVLDKHLSKIKKDWGSTDGQRIFDYYIYIQSLESDERRCSKNVNFDPYAPDILNLLEKDLKATCST
ncbi:MAG: hypothetical protein ACSHX0_12285 [Akkermansiaceae bacterium]